MVTCERCRGNKAGGAGQAGHPLLQVLRELLYGFIEVDCVILSSRAIQAAWLLKGLATRKSASDATSSG